MNHITIKSLNIPVNKSFSVTVDNLSLSPHLYLLQGKNGSGKSVFLRYLAKLMPPNPSITNNCQRILYLTHDDISFPNLTIEENLILNHHIFKIKSHIDTSLFSQEDLTTLCKNASLGMRHKVGLSLVLVEHFWDLIILDESLSNVDSQSQKKILKAMIERQKEGTILVAVEHHLTSILPQMQSLYMEGGRLYEN